MEHLPGTFKDKLIAEIFLDIDGERASVVLAKYHNAHRRLNSKYSSSFKGFVWLNEKECIRLNRGLFSFTGVRHLAPIKEIYLLRDYKCKEDYTTISSALVDMTTVTRTDESKIPQKVQVGVITIQPIECIMNSSS